MKLRVSSILHRGATISVVAVMIFLGCSGANAGSVRGNAPPTSFLRGDIEMVQENIATLRKLFATINAGELDKISGFAHPDFVRHDLTGAIPGVEGRAGAVDFIRGLMASISGLHLDIVDIFGADDKVTVRFVARGRHTGEMFGMPPTGRELTINNVNIYRLQDGKIRETWQLADGWGMMRQVSADTMAP